MKKNRALIIKENVRRSKKTTKSRKKVVFANGCFDLLYSGHRSLLEKAKS
jgi:bifunctional ADP-heptose synthase (sugar kinase/adenylyltransferase)